MLAGAGERAPADALRLGAVAAGTAGAAGRVDLAGMWALTADPAAPRSHELIRALDGKGRLMLPITVAQAASVPAERDGALVTELHLAPDTWPTTGQHNNHHYLKELLDELARLKEELFSAEPGEEE